MVSSSRLPSSISPFSPVVDPSHQVQNSFTFLRNIKISLLSGPHPHPHLAFQEHSHSQTLHSQHLKSHNSRRTSHNRNAALSISVYLSRIQSLSQLKRWIHLGPGARTEDPTRNEKLRLQILSPQRELFVCGEGKVHKKRSSNERRPKYKKPPSNTTGV